MQFFREMISRYSLRNLRRGSQEITAATSGTVSEEQFMPKQIAKQMRLAGPVRIQDQDYLHVFSSTPKPRVSGPLAIGQSCK